MASSAPRPPAECAIIARSGPSCSPTALIAARNGLGLVSSLGVSPWAGPSKATTLQPSRTSGATNAPSCVPRPSQPWTRRTGGPLPQRVPASPVWQGVRLADV